MKKTSKMKAIFVCQNCEASFPKWQGQCGECSQWNTLVEEVVKKKGSGGKKSQDSAQSSKILVRFPEVGRSSYIKNRFLTSIQELDRVLGGGLVEGAVILLGGEPGIGKSTLLTQMVLGLLQKMDLNKTDKSALQGPLMYVCGEESPAQVVNRIDRLLKAQQYRDNNSSNKKNTQNSQSKTWSKQSKNLLFVTSTDIDEIITVIKKEQPMLVIIDSVQTMSTEDLTGASGSVGQIRECADRISSHVKALGIPTFLVGHVTKDGTIAGPKVLEHIVDAVVELSGERSGQLRILRALKNRFGATDEVGVFKVVEHGLEEVINPNEMFIEENSNEAPGSSIVCIMEGTRPILVEVQALVVGSSLAMPRRVGRGIKLSRIQVLSAVLQKHCGLPLGTSDIFLSVVGGFKISEPAVDLGLAVAIAASLKNKKISERIVCIGEVGLLGEIRTVARLDKRIKEVKRMGFKKIISVKTHKRVKEVLRELGL